jgi:hypothetical protein
VEQWQRKVAGPLLPVLATLGGALLFAYAVRSVGIAELAGGIARVGWGLVPILALAGLRFLLRAQCWRLCMPPGTRLPFGRAVAAFLAGDAVGNLTPLGLAASEPTKLLLARPHLATRDAVASLAVDNLIYLASVITVVAVGAVLLASTVPLPFGPLQIGAVLVLVIGAAAWAGSLLLRGIWSPADGARPPWRESLARARESVRQFSAANRTQVARVFAIHMGFHGLSMLENYLTLYWLLGAPPTVTQAVVFEALNRVLTAAFKFIPFRVGIDEAASGQLALLLGLPPVVAIASALVRKIRNLFWTAAGLALIGVYRARAGRATDPPGNASARRT